jgi:mono/diheme cytochrome c family protein/glucose/arabinose dehydrogenase
MARDGQKRGGVRGVRIAGVLLVCGATTIVASWAGRARAVPEDGTLTPGESLAAMKIQPGFRVSVAASEPMVLAPVAMNFGPDGRLWVVEMQSYMPDAHGTNEQMPTSRILILADKDRDGRFEESTVFMDGLILPRSVAPCRDGALVLAPPKLYFCRDTDGDGAADQRYMLMDGIEGANNPEHAPNAIVYGMDNWWHLSQCGFDFQFDGESIRTRPTSAHGQWGITMDDEGLLYYTPNSTALLGDLIPKHAASINPLQQSFAGVNEVVCSDNATWPAHPTPGVNRGYQDNVLRKDGRLASLTAACGPSCNRAGGLGEDLRGDFFICEPAGNLVKRLARDRTSDRTRAVNAYQDEEFLASTDERFRPVWSTIGPDGALYICDMYRGVIQHKTYMSSYLREQVLGRKLESPLNMGRIYRITSSSTAAMPVRRPAAMSGVELVDLLKHPDGWWRDTAQRLLVERGDKQVVSRLRELLTSESPVTRLHALWTLDGLKSVEAMDLDRAISDASIAVVRAGLRLVGTATLSGEIEAKIAGIVERSDPITAAYGVLGLTPRLTERHRSLLEVLERRVEDREVRDACVAMSRGIEHILLEAVLKQGKTRGRESLVNALANCLLAGNEQDRTQLARLTFAAIGEEQWAAGLLTDRWRSAARVETSSPRVLSFAEDPRWNELLAGSKAPRLAEVLRMSAWPGHEAEGAPEVRKELSKDERSRYARGEQLYHNCIACHMKDGKGTPGQVPPLAGSERLLGRVDIPIRILLHGLEGELQASGNTYRGQMPATTITGDGDLASILTYVRRSFGNEGTAVDPADVQRVRELTKSRNRTWTQAELDAAKKEPF